MASVNVILDMGVFYFAQPKREGCTLCKGACVIELEVNEAGYCCGTVYLHDDNCRALFCPHNVKLTLECPACEEEYSEEAHGKDAEYDQN